MILNQNLPYLSKKIEEILSKCSESEVRFEKSKDNLDIPFYKNLYIHSKYYPKKESKQYSFSENQEEQCIALGFGAGYHLAEYAQTQKVIVICLDPILLSAVLSRIDLTRLFPVKNLIIISLEEICNYFDFFLSDSYFLIIHRVFQKIMGAQITRALTFLKDHLNTNLLDSKTQKSFGKIWLKNCIKNFKLFFDSFFDESPLTIDKKVILVTGAGPSLEQNIDFINANRDIFYIAATDTSFKILTANNIRPDSIFTFDSSPYTNLQFLNSGRFSSPRLFMDFLSPIHNTSLRPTLLFTDHPFKNFLKEIHFHTVDFPSRGRNIGTSIISFFKKYFPDYPIVVAGIDFAYFKYSAYSHHSYQHEYKIVHNTYLNTSDNIDASIFYRKPFVKQNRLWKATSLQTLYNEETLFSDIYTLSDSPYTCFKNKPDISLLFTYVQKLKQGVLNFSNSRITNKDFFTELEKYVSQNPEPLLPYFLAIRKRPDSKSIQILLEEIKIILG